LSASTPERDLGLMKFKATTETPYHYSLEEVTMPDDMKKKPVEEVTMGDDAAPEEDVNPTLVKAVVAAVMQSPMMKQLEELLNHLQEEEGEEGEEMPEEGMGDKPMPDAKKDAAKFNEPAPVKFEEGGGAMPSGSNTFMPSSSTKDKKEYAMSDDFKVKYEALEQRVKAAEEKAALVAQMNEKLSRQSREEHAARQYEALKAEGYELDETDLKLMSTMQLESQKQHAEIVRRKYKKAPVNTGLKDLVQYSRTAETTTETFEDVAKISEWGLANGIFDYNEAKLKYSAAK
jgi:hypothetical protein